MDALKPKLKNFTQGKKYVGEILKKQQIDIPFHNEEIELILQYHPDKNDKDVENIEYLIIQKRPPFYKGSLYIKTKNNELDDISYVSCLRRLFELPDANNQIFSFERASRDTIYNSKMIEFKKNSNNTCCSICQSTDKLCIDHFNISFTQILDEFVNIEKVERNRIKTVMDISNNMFEFVDKDYEKKWIEYHDNKAVFRFLCKSCNSKEGCYGYKTKS